MKYTVNGPVPVATAKGDVDPGGTLDAKDLPEYVNVDALVAAGHLGPEKKAASGGSQGSAN
jgi:hypothetical protein